jgi:succinate dehydrogenase / fumarate reductase membrane anchor subunit
MVTIETPRSPRSRKHAKWEKWGWLYMRYSGVVLLVLIFGHLFINLYSGEGIKAIDFAFVAGKWTEPFWQVYDVSMLWLALIHGTNGMRTIVNDYTERETVRKRLNYTLWIVCGALIILGTLVCVTFDPCIDQNAVNYLPQVCKG